MANLKYNQALAIYMLVTGVSVEDVAKTVGETPETILKWLIAAHNKAERDINKWKHEYNEVIREGKKYR